MDRVQISAGDFTFQAELEFERAPRTCDWFQEQLPFRSQVIHARWSGEAVWIPLGNLDSAVPQENHTTYPSRGDILFYPGGISEAEVLIVYGSASFASKMGPIAGNHFATIDLGKQQLEAFGSLVLLEGAQDVEFTPA